MGIYHTGSNIPNILLVDQLQERIADNLRCIIEASHFRDQNLWREIYGPETHLGNIYNFADLERPMGKHYDEKYWGQLREFRKRLQKLCEAHRIPWDDVARSERLNLHVIRSLHELVPSSDDALLSILMRCVFHDPFSVIRTLVGNT